MKNTTLVNPSKFCKCRKCTMLHEPRYLKDVDIRALGLYFKAHQGKEMKQQALQYLYTINLEQDPIGRKEGRYLRPGGVGRPEVLEDAGELLAKTIRAITDLESQVTGIIHVATEDEKESSRLIDSVIDSVDSAARQLAKLFTEPDIEPDTTMFIECAQKADDAYHRYQNSYLSFQYNVKKCMKPLEGAAELRDELIETIEKLLKIVPDKENTKIELNRARRLLTSPTYSYDKEVYLLQEKLINKITYFFKSLSQVVDPGTFLIRTCETNFYCYGWLAPYFINRFEGEKHRQLLLMIAIYLIQEKIFIAGNQINRSKIRNEMNHRTRWYGEPLLKDNSGSTENLCDKVREFFDYRGMKLPRIIPDVTANKTTGDQVYLGVFLEKFGGVSIRQVYWTHECTFVPLRCANMRSIFLKSPCDVTKFAGKSKKKSSKSKSRARRAVKVPEESEAQDISAGTDHENDKTAVKVPEETEAQDICAEIDHESVASAPADYDDFEFVHLDELHIHDDQETS